MIHLCMPGRLPRMPALCLVSLVVMLLAPAHTVEGDQDENGMRLMVSSPFFRDGDRIPV